MVKITFPDQATEKRAIGFLLGRFSGRIKKRREHLVPEIALEALAQQNIPFSVKGKAANQQPIPKNLSAALSAYPKARRIFESLPPSHQREFIKWIEEARKPETGRRRAEKSVQMLLKRMQSKNRN